MIKRLSNKSRKNLLDLEFNKNLQYFNTSIILLFTYIIGVTIVFLTKQIDYRNPKQLLLVILVSIVIIVAITAFMFNFDINLKKISKEIKTLKF